MPMFKIVETDNYGGEYPNESFLNIAPVSQEHAKTIAKAINNAFQPNFHRYWTVEPVGYVLRPGFEP